MGRMTPDDAAEFARRAHAGQVDAQGRDYFEHHLLPIAALLRPFGDDAATAGLLHDVLEDTEATADDLRALGLPDAVVTAVESVTRRDGEPYEDLIERASAHPLGRLVKLADNWHNLSSNAELARHDPEKAARLRERYVAARRRLTASLTPAPTAAADPGSAPAASP
jgi:(p)ppGpp synthase/HD superfamily hydrolase